MYRKKIILLLVVIVLSFAQVAFASDDKEYDSYRIGPSDILEIVVWREPALSKSEIVVRPDGRISLPLIDDILAAGRTPVQLKDEIADKIKKFVQNPSVYVIVSKANSCTFSVLGNVTRPGVYSLLKKITVLQGIAIAGGFNEWAEKDNIIVLRGSGKEQQRFVVDYSEIISGDNPEQNISLMSGDLIITP